MRLLAETLQKASWVSAGGSVWFSPISSLLLPMVSVMLFCLFLNLNTELIATVLSPATIRAAENGFQLMLLQPFPSEAWENQ